MKRSKPSIFVVAANIKIIVFSFLYTFKLRTDSLREVRNRFLRVANNDWNWWVKKKIAQCLYYWYVCRMYVKIKN